MATEKGYSVHKAIADLMQMNLLQSVLMPVNSRLVPCDPADAFEKNSSDTFSGAGLDSRSIPNKMLFVALAGEQVDGRDYVKGALAQGNWALTRTLGNDQPDPLVGLEARAGGGVLLCADPEKALACLSACWRKTLAVEIVAITGTNGKTTTKDLVRAMLSGAGKTQSTPGNLNNHLGLPLTLLNIEEDTRFAVIEMGASSVGEIDFLADLTGAKVGIITNASAAHLSEFGSLEKIIQGKGELLDHLPVGGYAILNNDSPGYKNWCDRSVCQIVSWGLNDGDHRWDWKPSKNGQQEELILDAEPWKVPLPGRHNAANLCAAILACRALGIEDTVLRKALNSFQGSAHRGLIVDWEGRVVLDDSYNANPASMVAAVRALVEMQGTGQTVAVLGAMAEMGSDSEAIHEETGRNVARENLNILLAVGSKAFPMCRHKFENCRTIKWENHSEAAEWLKENTAPGDRILIKGSRSSGMEKVLQLLLEANASPKEETEE